MPSPAATFRNSLLAGGTAALGMAAYALFLEPRWLEVKRTAIPLPRLPRGLTGFRIAVLTDMHAGRGTPMALIRRACRLAMQAKPDLIALTGDFVSAEAHVPEAAVLDVLATLRAPLGVYAVPGNHDHARGIEEWKAAVAAHENIIDLTNRALTIDHADARLGIAGVDDFSTGGVSVDPIRQVHEADLRILLAHDPDTAEMLPDLGLEVDLVLSGHTHGGQVRVPFWGALTNPVMFSEIYEKGLVKRPWTSVYISRGVGTVHYPVRFMCRPEVAILELVPA